jgi:hypothetical protein
MLRFILRSKQCKFSICRVDEKEFIKKILTYKAGELSKNNIIEEIEGIKRPDSILAVNNKLFMQIPAFLEMKEVQEVKDRLLLKAIGVFSNPDNFGPNGEFLKAFVIGSSINKIFSPTQMRQFLLKCFIELVTQNRKDELVNVSSLNYINILESSVFNGLISAREILECTAYGLEKISFGDDKMSKVNKLLVVHSFYLKKLKNSDQAAEVSTVEDSLLTIMMDTIQKTKTYREFEGLGLFMFLSNLWSNRDVMKGSKREQKYSSLLTLLELEFETWLKLKSADFSEHLLKVPEDQLSQSFEVLTSLQQLHSSPGILKVMIPALFQRLERDYRKMNSLAITLILSFVMKLDSDFRLTDKYLSILVISMLDPVNSLNNSAILLELFIKHPPQEETIAAILKIEKFLVQFLNDKELCYNRQNLKQLIQVFQTLVALNRGNLELFRCFFELFSQNEILDLLGPIPLFIKFIPSLGVKTKRLAGAVTNISQENSSNLNAIATGLNEQIKPSLVQVLCFLTKAVEIFGRVHHEAN